MRVTIKGVVEIMQEEKQVSDKYTKRIIIVDAGTEDEANPIAVEFGNKRMDLLSDVRKGDAVEIDAMLNGFQGKKDPDYFGLSLSGMSCKMLDIARDSGNNSGTNNYPF